MRRIPLFPLVTMLVAPFGPVKAEEPLANLSLYGEWRGQYGLESHHLSGNRVRLWAEVDVAPMPLANGEVSFLANATLDHDFAAVSRDGRERASRLDPGEIYGKWSNDAWTLSLGNRLIRWGVADGVSMSDTVNPVREHDPLVSGRQSARRPIPLAHVSYGGGGRTVEAVVLPWAGVYRYPAAGSAWFPAGTSISLEDQRLLHDLSREAEPHAPEAGFRFSSYGQSIDWAVSAFHGFNDTPRLDQSGALPSLTYDRQTSFALNVSSTVGDNVVRSEFGVSPDHPFSGRKGELVHANRYGTVWGIDRSFDDDWSMSGQAFAFLAPDAPGGTDAMTTGVTWSVTKEWPAEKITVGLTGQKYFTTEECAAEISFQYEIDDLRKAIVAIGSFSGSDSAYRANDYLTLTLRNYF